MSTATLDGYPVTECIVAIPSWGVWWVEVELAAAVTLSGSVDFVISDLELSGTIVSGGVWQGRSRYMVAAGAGGWGSEIPADSESNDAGVKRATVFRKAATACGETFDETSTSGTIGVQYARQGGVASRTLSILSPRAWYVDNAGVTKAGQRLLATYNGPATRLNYDAAQDRLDLAANELTTLLPGTTVDSVTAVDVVHTLRKGELRTTLWGDGKRDTSALPEAFRKVIEGLDPMRDFRAQWEYRIVSQSGERLNLQIVRASTGMPDLQRVRVRPGVPGMTAEYAIGARVVVAFVDADPVRPAVVSFEYADSPGFFPDLLNLGSSPRLEAARRTDKVQCGPYLGQIQQGSDEVSIGGSATPGFP
jgi:hypothetical protein